MVLKGPTTLPPNRNHGINKIYIFAYMAIIKLQSAGRLPHHLIVLSKSRQLYSFEISS